MKIGVFPATEDNELFWVARPLFCQIDVGVAQLACLEELVEVEEPVAFVVADHSDLIGKADRQDVEH